MTDAGITLAEALAGLMQQTDQPGLRALLEQLHGHVQAGEDFSAALSRYPQHFSPSYVNLVKAGEASGSVPLMLDRLAAHLQRDQESRSRVRGALAYPAVMLCLSILACVFLLTYVFPKIEPMFAARGVELPTPTRFALALSHSLTEFWWVWLSAGLGLVWGGRIAFRQPWGRDAWDWFVLNCPGLGGLMRRSILARSLRSLATTINAGVPALESLRLCAATSENVYFERAWSQVTEQVASGRQIHEVLEDDALFPQTLTQMVGSGERSGKLGTVLNKISDYYESEVAATVKTLTTLLEPLMVVVMGAVIGGLALAMLLPIFRLSTHVG